ncbi:MAG: response regulator [Salibacteraceae bacterium]
MPNKALRIALVDDDRLFNELLTNFLHDQDHLEVVHAATGGTPFLDWLATSGETVDVVLLDLRMPDGDGLSTLHQLYAAYSSVKVVVLSTFYRRSFMGQMLQLGADAFLPKAISQKELLQALEGVAQNGHYFTPEQVDTLRTQLSNKVPQWPAVQKDGLSDREIEVLRLYCQQLSTQEIAQRLFLSAKTVESHRSNLYAKTGTRNAAGLVIYAIQNQLIDPDELVLVYW